MKGLQIKCLAIGEVGTVEFLDENDVVLMKCMWAGEKSSHAFTRSVRTGEMTKIAESIRELAMKIGD